MVLAANIQGSRTAFNEQQKNTISLEPFPTAITDPNAKAFPRHHRLGHHIGQFDPDGASSIVQRYNLGNRPKRQHFIAGKPAGGSASNGLVYGSSPATAPFIGKYQSQGSNGVDQSVIADNGREKSLGFLYGYEDTKVGKPKIGTKREKDGLPTWMKDKTSAEIRKREMQAKEIEDDIARHRLEKAKQQAKRFEEQREDLEMLKSYRPWGKPGGGAPRGIENDRMATVRTKRIDSLSDDRSQLLPLGKPGGGAPNRTESGRIQTKNQVDSQIRVRAHRDGRPIDALPLNSVDYGYRTELEKLAEETRFRRYKEKEQDLENEKESLKYHPFGRPGAGAPLKGEDGSPRTGLPLQLSNNIYELRNKEPKHPHAFSGANGGLQDSLPRKPSYASKDPVYNPKDDDELQQGFQFGMPGGGAPLRNKDGKIVTYTTRTLVKDKTGALVKSPPIGAPNFNDGYFPFGKPGAGAPIRDEKGKLKTTIAGNVDNAKLGNLELPVGTLDGKREYLATLQRMKEEKDKQRQAERNEIRKQAPGVASWIKQGVVGQPKYDPYTHEIIANPLTSSDVTRHRMDIRQHQPVPKRDYQLQKEAEEKLKARYEDDFVINNMYTIMGQPDNGGRLRGGRE